MLQVAGVSQNQKVSWFCFGYKFVARCLPRSIFETCQAGRTLQIGIQILVIPGIYSTATGLIPYIVISTLVFPQHHMVIQNI